MCLPMTSFSVGRCGPPGRCQGRGGKLSEVCDRPTDVVTPDFIKDFLPDQWWSKLWARGREVRVESEMSFVWLFFVNQGLEC